MTGLCEEAVFLLKAESQYEHPGGRSQDVRMIHDWGFDSSEVSKCVAECQHSLFVLRCVVRTMAAILNNSGL